MAWTLDDLRAEIPVLRNKVYLNTGTLGPSPQAVTVAYIREYQRWQIAGPGWPREYVARRDGMATVRGAVAALIHAEPRDVALAENVTVALNWVIAAMDLHPGDEVVVGMDEHPANRYPWRALEAMGRIRVVPWPMQGDDEELLATLRERIGARTRAVTVSHILQTTGRILPIQEITRICREAGAASIIDGAQSVGQIPVDVRELAPDAYGFNGHKWLLGPVATAGVYVRPEFFQGLGLLPAGSGSAVHDQMGRDAPDVEWVGEPRRWEIGTKNWPLYDGLRRTLEILGEIGWERLRQRSGELVAQFLAELPNGVEEIRVPKRAAMASVRVPGMTGAELADALYREAKVVVRPVDELPAGSVRLSFAPFNNAQDIETALAAFARIARG